MKLNHRFRYVAYICAISLIPISLLIGDRVAAKEYFFNLAIPIFIFFTEFSRSNEYEKVDRELQLRSILVSLALLFVYYIGVNITKIMKFTLHPFFYNYFTIQMLILSVSNEVITNRKEQS